MQERAIMKNGSWNFVAASVSGRTGIVVCAGRDKNAGKVLFLFDDERGQEVGAWVASDDVTYA
jgi:hypothetical protein